MWIVAWRYNDKSYSESYGDRTLAELKMIQLQAYGLSPSLHFK